MMKAKDLIEILSEINSETLILVDGYEGGLSEIQKPELKTVSLNIHTEDYYGPHEESARGTVMALLLRRKSNIGPAN